MKLCDSLTILMNFKTFLQVLPSADRLGYIGSPPHQAAAQEGDHAMWAFIVQLNFHFQVGFEPSHVVAP